MLVAQDKGFGLCIAGRTGPAGTRRAELRMADRRDGFPLREGRIDAAGMGLRSWAVLV